MATGYKLKDSFLSDKLKDYKNLGKVDFSYQEYIESMFAPTRWLGSFFNKNSLQFNDNLSQEMSVNRKFEIADFCIRKSYEKLDISQDL